MADVVWFAHYTASGMAETLNMDVEMFEEALKASLEMYNLENKPPE